VTRSGWPSGNYAVQRQSSDEKGCTGAPSPPVSLEPARRHPFRGADCRPGASEADMDGDGSRQSAHPLARPHEDNSTS